MIIPMRCFTCNKPIAAIYVAYLNTKKNDKDSNLEINTSIIEEGKVTITENGKLLNDLGVHRYCCRRMILGQVDIVDVI